ncbi:hypothetical protein WJX74_003237 [Apatococcus lobatus]|uniref:Iron hydrogenase large subunit C-terminal domain-containing protein n=1 Tax=Apatococcus lobatus TaxID=904363 RepID=A0AAW1RDD4_9CHLO
MTFSGTVKLTDLNDFIAPSQACVVKTEGSKVSVSAATAGNGNVQLQQPRKAGFSQTKLLPSHSGAASADAVKVTLNDCLACSGCVTSAETVLLQQHSSSELLAALQDPSKRVVVSVSPQSRASLATRHGLSTLACFRKLRSVMRQMGVAYVLDTSCGRELSLLETSQELVHRMRLAREGATDLATSLATGGIQQGVQVDEGCYSLSAQAAGDNSVPHAGLPTSWLPSEPYQNVQLYRDSPGPQQHPAHGSSAGAEALASSSSAANISTTARHGSMDSLAAAKAPVHSTASSGRLDEQRLMQQAGINHSTARQHMIPAPVESSLRLPQHVAGARQVEDPMIEYVQQQAAAPSHQEVAQSNHDVSSHGNYSPDWMHVNNTGSNNSAQQVRQQEAHSARHQKGRSHWQDGVANISEGPLPLLVSSCPGWVVYAEKTHGSYILPHISTAKSPQGMMGSLVKRVLSRQLGLLSSDIFHCSIMPCYDRKLEAAREDLRLPGSAVPETDCVLATLDLQQLLDERGVSLSNQQLDEDDGEDVPGVMAAAADLSGVPGSAGGYFEHAFRTAAWELFRVRLPVGPLSMRRLRNDDFREVVLKAQGRTLLRFAAAYGFRNIQTLVRKIKRGGCEYDFIEIMACPSACLNGGGQLRPAQGETAAELLAAVSASYHDPGVRLQWPEQDPAVPQLLAELHASQQPGAKPERILRMSYKDRGKSQLSGMTPSAAADW